jgi:hypothetical protein
MDSEDLARKGEGPFLVEDNPEAESDYVDFIAHVEGARSQGAVFALKEYSIPPGRSELWHTISYGNITGYLHVSLSYIGSPKRSGFLKAKAIR